MGAGEIAQIATAVFAGGAAGAAIWAVRQGERLWRRGVEGELHPQMLENAHTGHVDMTILNVGGGYAKGVAFIIANRTHQVAMPVGDGFMAPGEKVHISTSIPLADRDNADCLVIYRTIDETSWGVDRVGPRWMLRKGYKDEGVTIGEVWDRKHKHLPRSSLIPAQCHITRAE